jgi:hypothetical protein
MAVLSVDLACRRWSDVGMVLLRRANHGTPRPGAPPAPIECQILSSTADGLDENLIEPEVLAGRLNHLCVQHEVRVLVLDGPQAWKSSQNGLEHARLSERILNTVTKTGLPGMTKPYAFRTYAEFCLDVYDALCRRGWRRLSTSERALDPKQRILVESSPHAAWKSLGISPLPAKRRAHVSDLARAFAALNRMMPILTNRAPNHDQLQAIIGGLSGLALEERNNAALRIVGAPPRREDGHWREGFIVLPVPPQRLRSVHWLN